MIGPALPSVTVPYARDLADAVLRGAGDHGLSVLMTQTHGDVRRERGVRDDPYLRHVDGILLAPVARRPSPSPKRRPWRCPRRNRWSRRPRRSVPEACICFDTGSFAAARAVLAHLVARGRRRYRRAGPPGGGEARPAESDVRCQEYVAGLRDAGLPVRPERVVRTERVPFASGAAAARALLGQAPDTDAVFALGDALAPGALRGLHDAGRVVPDDTAVAGFANVAQAAFSTPPSPRSAPAARNWPGVPCRSSPNSPGRGRPGVPLPPARHHTVGFRLAEREPSGVPAQ
nr:substrate-binding domain-containing protein [Streptomyces olivaceus]